MEKYNLIDKVALNALVEVSETLRPARTIKEALTPKEFNLGAFIIFYIFAKIGYYEKFREGLDGKTIL